MNAWKVDAIAAYMSGVVALGMRLLVCLLNDDDPSKCSARKLIRFNMLTKVYKPPYDTLLLDPYATTPLHRLYSSTSITVVDCSWANASSIFHRIRVKESNRRRLPLLLAANPINYAKLARLSTAEALAAACYILGYEDLSFNILNKFKWGHTFMELNRELLEEYKGANTIQDIVRIEEEYFKIKSNFLL